MQKQKTLSSVLCSIYREAGADVLKNPQMLCACMADFAPEMKAEREQMQMLFESGCAKQMMDGAEPSIESLVFLSKRMDGQKAQELCRIYASALLGKEYIEEQSKFSLSVEDVFQITGRGMVVTGWVRGGSVRVGDPVIVLCANGAKRVATIGAIEQFKQLMDTVEADNAVGILLPELRPGEVQPGDLIIAQSAAGIQIPQFQLVIDNFFPVEGRGTAVTGWVQGTSIKVGNSVAIVKSNGSQRRATVSGIERYQQLLDHADPGEAVGILLHEVNEKEIAIGDRLVLFAWWL